MTDTTYRAAYLLSSDGQHSTVLTLPEHADLADDDLLAEARAEMNRAALDTDDQIVIGDWVE